MRDNKAEYFVEIPLAKLPPGRYWMQVNVRDAARSQTVLAPLPLAILKSPACEPAKAAGGGR